MSSTLEALYDAEKKISTCLDSVISASKCKRIEDLGEDSLIHPQISKKTLATLVLSLVKVVNSTHDVLKNASVKMEDLQTDCIVSQKSVIKLQEQLIQSKEEEVSAVQSTVKSELKSWADTVSNSGKKTEITTKSIQSAVRSAIGEDQRSRNLIIFGLKEGKDNSLRATIDDIVGHCSGDNSPAVKDCVRLGGSKADFCRPVKVSFETKEAAIDVVSCATKLRRTVQYKNVYISPDRSAEERVERRQLVQQLKEKIKSEPNLYHVIHNRQIQSSQKRTFQILPTNSPTSETTT